MLTRRAWFQSAPPGCAGHRIGLGLGAFTSSKLQPIGKVFDPEAIMNPFYLGGDKRELLPTDIAGLRALYASRTK